MIVYGGKQHEKSAENCFRGMVLGKGTAGGDQVFGNHLEEKDLQPIFAAAMWEIGQAHGLSVAQVGTAWAIAKGTLPIIGVTKVRHVEDAAQAAGAVLTAEEIERLETLADKANVSTIREWEKKME